MLSNSEKAIEKVKFDLIYFNIPFVDKYCYFSQILYIHIDVKCDQITGNTYIFEEFVFFTNVMYRFDFVNSGTCYQDLSKLH